MSNNQPIPEEIKEWLKPLESHFGLRYGQGAEAMYRHLAPEIEAKNGEIECLKLDAAIHERGRKINHNNKISNMEVQLLTEEKEAAAIKYKEYLQASKTCRDKTYDSLKKVYNQIRKGKSVIDVTDAIRNAGVRDNFHPYLAIARANSKEVRCIYRRNGDVQYRSSENTFRLKRSDIVIPDCFKKWDGGPWELDLKAPTPIIPPRLRPQTLSEDFYILWEVDTWTPMPSRDPYLLKRITNNLFVVCAAWDLTDIEIKVMAERIKP